MNNAKKYYSVPELEIVSFAAAEVICTSGTGCGTGGNELEYEQLG